MIPSPVRIMGLDPGLRCTGWGIIDVQGHHIRHIAHGIVQPDPNQGFGQRLLELFQTLSHHISTFSPTEAAVEETFVNKNPLSTLKLGMARGVVLLAPAFHHVLIAEYAANRIKKAVVGVGHASKDQVSHMIQHLLPQSGGVKLDAADALAAAICHAHFRQTFQRQENQQTGHNTASGTVKNHAKAQERELR